MHVAPLNPAPLPLQFRRSSTRSWAEGSTTRSRAASIHSAARTDSNLAFFRLRLRQSLCFGLRSPPPLLRRLMLRLLRLLLSLLLVQAAAEFRPRLIIPPTLVTTTATRHWAVSADATTVASAAAATTNARKILA